MTRVEEVRAGVERCAAGRSVSLMAVSKTHPYSAVLEAYESGQRLFGENRVQEVLQKFPPKEERPEGMRLCLIGHLQTNKVKKIIPYVDRIDSVDSIELLRVLERECAKLGITMPLLLEFNSSGEEQKSGFKDEAELIAAAGSLVSYPHLEIHGIMTVGPLGGDEDLNTQAFLRTKALYERIKTICPTCTTLSMGMSGDYPLAIECGSNEVRIGTAIFGERS